MRDFIEAGLDITLQHPLVGVGRQVVDLGQRVMRPASGAETVAARSKIRLENGLEHQFEGCLHGSVPSGGYT